MNAKLSYVLVPMVLAGVLAAQNSIPEKSRSVMELMHKTVGSPTYAPLNINNILAWKRADRGSSLSPHGDNNANYPLRSTNVIYVDGLIFGGKVYRDAALTKPGAQGQIVRVGGASYGWSTRAGWVNGSGANATPESPSSPNVHIYRIRRDYFDLYREKGEAGFLQEAADINEHTTPSSSEASAVFNQYASDWATWPVEHGAPYIERNGIPGYQPPPQFSNSFSADSLISDNYDEPGIAGINSSAPADQVIFTVYNDLNVTQSLVFAASYPMGIEIQETDWAYRSAIGVGNMYFTRYRLINKGGVDTSLGGVGQNGAFWIDSLFVGKWSDTDVGNAGDDLIGCDSLLQLGYAYNGFTIDYTFNRFGLNPASVGYVLLQGPTVAGSVSDSALKDFRYEMGKRNLSMSSFGYGSQLQGSFCEPFDCFNSYSTSTGHWWKGLRGFVYPYFASFSSPDSPYLDKNGRATKFPCSGDPVLRIGYIDGAGFPNSFAPGDRRLMVNTGPFTMAPGDTQEIVYATIGATGGTNLTNIYGVKRAAASARAIAGNLFDVPRPPVPPTVKAVGLNREIILEWGSDRERIQATETELSFKIYAFEGYNIYQLRSPGAPREEWNRIATFDVVNGVRSIVETTFDPSSGLAIQTLAQQGTDAGVKRSMQIKKDYFTSTEYFATRLNNGQRYYYAVTAYNYQAGNNDLPHSLESDPVIVSVQPRIPFDEVLTHTYGDTLDVTHTTGSNDGRIVCVVVDASAGTGDTYEVRLDSLSRWSLINVSRDRAVSVSRFPLSTGEQLLAVEGGIRIEFLNVQKDFYDFRVAANGYGPIVPPSYGAFAGTGLPQHSISHEIVGAPDRNKGGVRWGIYTGQTPFLTTAVNSYDYFKSRVTGDGSNWDLIGDDDYEIRFTQAGGKAFVADTNSSVGGTIINTPFEVWRIGRNTPTDTTDDVRLFPFVDDRNGDGIFALSGADQVLSGGDNDPETDWISVVVPDDDSPGQSGYNALLSLIQSNPASYVHLAGAKGYALENLTFVSLNGGSVSDPSFPNNQKQVVPEQGTIFRIVTNKWNVVGDVFTFTIPSPQHSSEITKASINRLGVFPNPYYAGQSQGASTTRNFVTFNNLPRRATILLYNLAGQLVRTLVKDDASQFFEWDLMNESHRQVASGMYICRVELPDLGTVRVLKLAIIQSQVFPSP